MRKFKNKNAAVIGLGFEGRDVVKFLLKVGAKVTIYDKKQLKELDFEDINPKNVNLITGENYLSAGLTKYDIIFRSPGVYRYLPEIVEAEKRGSEISNQVKLFFELFNGKIIGVTGTKGKGTTSTLIYEFLKNSGKDVYISGNIGAGSLLNLLENVNKDCFVVLELSSFQLIDLTKSPHIAVVLNITSDHLDWHKNVEEYVTAKKNIVSHQEKYDFSVINSDYKTPKSFAKYTKSKVYYFSKNKKVKGCFVNDGNIVLEIDHKKEIIGKANDLLLRGEHNWENITAAVCASFHAGANLKAIRKVVFSFKGLEHRLELVGEKLGAKFYNDSFATGPQPTIAAIRSFTEPTTIILGGYDKGLDYDELGKVIAESDHIQGIILIGDLAQKIEKVIKNSGYKNKLANLGKSEMKVIIKKAVEFTPKGGNVLLSPAAASFDMFESYKERGKKFKEIVKSM